jgi:hypothetical protein
MKKIIISLILSLTAIVAMAQTNYYPNTTGTITKSGYTYKYRNFKMASGKELPDKLKLYNSDVRFLDKEIVYKDGTLMPLRTPSPYSGESMTKEQVETMIIGKFTFAQKATLGGKFLWIEGLVDTSTGRVVDVYFTFGRNTPFVNIPVETYRSIELAIKQQFTVTVSAEGLRRNYIHFSWSPDF